MTSLETCKALIFDCYGTLIDWEVGMYQNLDALWSQKTCPEPDRLFKVLGELETRIQGKDEEMIYPEVLELVYKELTGHFRLWHDPEAGKEFGDSVGSWPAFPDSAAALGKLRELGLKLFVLSNVDNESFAITRKKLETETKFDGVYTAEDIGSYKPDLRNFRYALDRLDEDFNISPEQVIVVANSKFHDISPAHRMGLKAAWINRPEAIMGVQGFEDIKPDWTFGNMEEFVDGLKSAKEEF
ncbi:haloacid dehalogenase, type II [Cryptococcus neoformans]|nr:haloacid dehalogenase, type II [Cryptococcus neoformans var. grubii]OWZ72449.1 haloacid dehalogenase, type II [Cryptococcus neoformans var. grubii]